MIRFCALFPVLSIADGDEGADLCPASGLERRHLSRSARFPHFEEAGLPLVGIVRKQHRSPPPRIPRFADASARQPQERLAAPRVPLGRPVDRVYE